MNRHSVLSSILLITVILSGCSETRPISGRDKGLLGGAALGAGLGAIVGHATGRTGEGIAIGSGVGALAGGVLGNESDTEDDRYNEQEERLTRQDEELRRQRREIQELRGSDSRDDYYDDQYPTRSRDTGTSSGRYNDSYRY